MAWAAPAFWGGCDKGESPDGAGSRAAEGVVVADGGGVGVALPVLGREDASALGAASLFFASDAALAARCAFSRSINPPASATLLGEGERAGCVGGVGWRMEEAGEGALVGVASEDLLGSEGAGDTVFAGEPFREAVDRE